MTIDTLISCAAVIDRQPSKSYTEKLVCALAREILRLRDENEALRSRPEARLIFVKPFEPLTTESD